MRGLIEISIVALLMLSAPAFSQDIQHPLTIADCPKGTVLAVQDSADPQPFMKQPPTDNTFDGQQKWQAEQANQVAQAPRQFATGCIPKQQNR